MPYVATGQFKPHLMIEKLKNPQARQIFVVICTGAILFAGISIVYVNIVLRPSCDPLPADSLARCSTLTQIVIDTVPPVAISFISSALTALFFIAVLYLVKEKEDAVGDVEILFQPSQRSKHREALSASRFWYHDGHLASWVTKFVLPTFQQQCEEYRAICEIKVAIMDPTNNRVCQTYLEHIRGLPKEEKPFPDLATVKAEICASIYRLVRGYQRHHLNVEIYLKDRIDFIRDDISDSRAFWTTVGSSAPAISLINRSNQFLYYNLVKKNFFENLPLYERVEVEEAYQKLQQSNLSSEVDRIKLVLESIFPRNPDLYSEENINRVACRL